LSFFLLPLGSLNPSVLPVRHEDRLPGVACPSNCRHFFPCSSRPVPMFNTRSWCQPQNCLSCVAVPSSLFIGLKWICKPSPLLETPPAGAISGSLLSPSHRCRTVPVTHCTTRPLFCCLSPPQMGLTVSLYRCARRGGGLAVPRFSLPICPPLACFFLHSITVSFLTTCLSFSSPGHAAGTLVFCSRSIRSSAFRNSHATAGCF